MIRFPLLLYSLPSSVDSDSEPSEENSAFRFGGWQDASESSSGDEEGQDNVDIDEQVSFFSFGLVWFDFSLSPFFL